MEKTDRKLRDGSFAYLHDCSRCGLPNAYESRKGKVNGFCNDCLSVKRAEASKKSFETKREYKAKEKLEEILTKHGLTREGFNLIFDYHEEGVITWKDTFGPKMQKGSIAGSWQGNGYKNVKFNGKSIGCHRVIWIMHNGDITDGLLIDHIDRNPKNNSITNLRVVTYQENNWNTDAKGFVKVGEKYNARITKDGKVFNLGYFTSPKEAAAAYKGAKSILHII